MTHAKRKAASVLQAVFLTMTLLLVVSLAQAQERTTRGTVVDEKGEPIIGASILIKGSTTGTISDLSGSFTLQAKTNDVLEISYVGFQTQSIAVQGQTQLRIVLIEDTKALSELVVIGYGTVKKSDVTGAITSISEKAIRERPVQNAISAMQGKAAGVDILTNVRPGEISSVVIRGTRSINAANTPLYVVDGVILMGSMNDINPNDIASIEVLKDASSTAIYGSRGANGVILITTKSAKKGKVSVEYSNTTSVDVINSLTKWASAGEMLDRVRTAYINGGEYLLGTTPLTEPNLEADINKFGHSDAATIAALNKAWEGGSYNPSAIPTTDWIGMLTQNGVTQNHQLSFSSANENSKIYTSIGYYSAEGNQTNQQYDRYTIRMNGETSPVKWFNLGTNVNIAMSEQEYGNIVLSGTVTGPRDLYSVALSQYLMAQPYDAQGELIVYPGNNNAAPVWNPFINLEHTSDLTRVLNVQANMFANIQFTPWLSYRMNLGTGYRTSRSGSWSGSESTSNRMVAKTASASYSNSENMQYLIENILNFNQSFDVHSISATLMQAAQHYQSESLNISASKILYDTSKWFNLAANLNGKPDSYGSGFTENNLTSYMGRINYALLDRYLLSASMRYDGASVLAPGHKWDMFPSLALAWKMQDEPFLQNFKKLDELKVRFGYGVTGNAAVGAYTTSGPLAQYNYVFGTTPAIGMIPYNMPNPNLGWEKTTQTNIGIDFGFFKRRVTGTLELYKSNTTDLLLDRSIPGIIGFVTILDNIGEMQNQGIEFNISTVNIQRDKFRWTTDLNISHNQEKIISLANGKEDMKGSGWYIGHPINVFRYFEVDGLWQNTADDLAEIAKWKANGYNFAPGQYKPVEQGEPNYKLEDSDKVIVGNPRPKAVIGFTNTFNYNDFELSVFLYGRLGQKYYYNLIPGGYAGGDYIGYGRKADLNEFWSETNTSAQYPQLNSKTATLSNADVNRSANIHDGSFIAVRNISLGYNIPAKWLKPLTLSSCNIFTQVLNPFMFGGDVVKAGINPDDTNNLLNYNSVGDLQGATNNNTYLTTSFVFGIRVGL